MVYSVLEMLKQIRWGTNHGEDEFSGSTALEMTFLNQAQDSVFDMISDVRPDILSTSFTITTDGSLQYSMPDYADGYFDYDKILITEDATDSENPLETSVTNWFNRMPYIQGTIPSSRIAYSIRDKYIELPRRTDGVTLKVWHTRRPVDLSYGTVAADAGSTDITLATTPTAGDTRIEDDYYNGMKVEVSGQVRLISDYVGSTHVCTVPAWTSAPTDESTYSLVSPLPERMHKLIVLEAIKNIRIHLDDDIDKVEFQIETEFGKIIKNARRPSRQGVWQVRKIGRNQ